MSYFEMRNGCVAVSDETVAAVLLCRSWYWGNKREERARFAKYGPEIELKPGTLRMVDRFFRPETGELRILFIIEGDVADLRQRRLYLHTGQLYIQPGEFKSKHKELIAIVEEAKEEARKRMELLRAGGAL